MTAGGKIIIFTDLDGTLLDESYSFTAAQPALLKMAELGHSAGSLFQQNPKGNRALPGQIGKLPSIYL